MTQMISKVFNSVVGKISGAFMGAVATGAAMSAAGDILSLMDRIIPGAPMIAGGIATAFAGVAAGYAFYAIHKAHAAGEHPALAHAHAPSALHRHPSACHTPHPVSRARHPHHPI
ncbi:MAG: hypothetical protein H6865_00505 [Rhodospirillales bacterium]|nr:hypothetical protein [Rhodospirillales bacterium]USO07332.1 MAG: hypothetical protein H6866_07870 [Rhodospirillales bacterium]